MSYIFCDVYIDFSLWISAPKPDLALQNCKIKKVRRDKSDRKQRPEPAPAAASAEIYTFNDSDDVEQDLCVVEVHGSMSTGSDQPCYASEVNSIELSAADKLKSQTAASNVALSNANAKAGNKKRRSRRGSGTSSEEERWLDAIESGKLEQVQGELKKTKDPKLMTARQRAMYERSIEKDTAPADDILLALPTGYKEKVMTAEAIEKAQQISKKRKQQADERREKNKRETMDRLLKKQESKVTKMAKSKIVKVAVPVITYYDSISHGSHISYPIEMEFPIKAQAPRQPPATILCGVCQAEQKRYNCSKTNTPLCSIACYKLNLQQKQIAVQSAWACGLRSQTQHTPYRFEIKIN